MSKTPSIFGGLCLALIATPLFAQVRINPNDDVTLRGETNYNATWPFGLFVKNSGDVSYIEFTLGVVSATQAKLVLYEAQGTAAAPWTVVVKGSEFSFDEATFTAYTTGSAWPQVGTIPGVQAAAFYELDLTAWYNDNLGKTMSLFLTRNTQPSGDGVIFEDKEGTRTGDAATYGPRLEVVESVLPPCKSLVTPEQEVTAIAFRNQAPAPSSFPYQVINGGTNSLDYNAVEMKKAAPAIANLYNTGVDNSRAVLGEQVLDPHWTIIAGGLDGTCTEGAPCSAYTVPADGYPIPPWLANDSTSLWITASQTDGDAAAPPGEHVFRTTFTLADQAAVDAALINGRMACDDVLTDVKLNGVTVVEGTGSWGFSSWQDYIIDDGFQIGTNTLDFTVQNGGTVSNPMGLRVEFFDIVAGDVSWLVLDKSGGTIPSGNSDTVTASIVSTDLPGGVHTAYVGITDNCAPAVTHIREIELTVIDCRSAVSPAANTGRAFRVGSAQNPAPVTFTFENTGASSVSYTVTSSASWLQLDKPTGVPIGPIVAGASDVVTGTIDPTGLAAGGHVATLTFTDTCNPAIQHVRQVLLSIDEPIASSGDTLQQFKAELTDFTASDLAAQSPLESCDPGGTTDRIFSVGYNSVGSLPAGWLTQGTIDGTPTTAKFDNPADGLSGRVRFRTFLPFDNTFDPAKGMAVAWNMRIGTDNNERGPIQITFPRVTGPFGTNEESSIPGDVFNVYVRVNDTTLRILNNGGGAIGTIDQASLPGIADQYHQWTASACYSAGDQMAYWNLWLDGEKLMFGGTDGTVIGPGGDIFSYRTGLNDVTGDPYIGLGDLNSEDVWDFEFDWVRMLSYNVSGCPFWDGGGSCAITVPWPDADDDGDVDQADFAVFQSCFSGDGNALSDPATCRRFNRDSDTDVDSLDVIKFEKCATGPGIPLDLDNLPTGCEL